MSRTKATRAMRIKASLILRCSADHDIANPLARDITVTDIAEWLGADCGKIHQSDCVVCLALDAWVDALPDEGLRFLDEYRTACLEGAQRLDEGSFP